MPDANANTELATLLVAARRSNTLTEGLPAPRSVADAMIVQAQVVKMLGEGIAGWKISLHPEFGPLQGALLASVTRPSGTQWEFRAPEGICGIEVEIGLRLSRDLPPGNYTREQVVAAISGMTIGIELVRSRLKTFATPFLPFLADSLGNEGYVLGEAELPFRALDLPSHGCIVHLDDQVLYDAPCNPALGDPVDVLVKGANAQADRSGGLRAGQIITTGTLCGLVPVDRPGRMSAEVTGIGRVTITFA